VLGTPGIGRDGIRKIANSSGIGYPPSHIASTQERRALQSSSMEHRADRGVECFLMHGDRERVPVWVFKPADAVDALAGLVINLSDGGLRVLTASADVTAQTSFEIQLLLGEDDSVPRFRGRATWVWTSEAAGSGWVSGLRFERNRSSADGFIRVYQSTASGRSWVRCLLLPTA
jgi:hypothetical protein